MDWSRTLTLRRLGSEAVKTIKQRVSKLKLDTVAYEKSTLVILAAMCGLFVASTQLLPAITQSGQPVVNVPSQQPLVAAIPDSSTLSTDGTQAQTNPLFASSPSWSQNFATQTSTVPDPLYWNVLVGPALNSNKEQQYYTDNQTNLRIEDGALRLIATQGAQPDGFNYGSARIETQGKQTFLYGRIDITAKLPAGVGTWPAVWMLPANNLYADKAPEGTALRYKNGGEMDIIEAVGSQPNVVYGVAHSASDLKVTTDGSGSHGTVKVPSSSTAFNKYSVLWTPTSVSYAVNEVPYFTYNRKEGADYTTWPFDQPFYLIANLAIGGSWGGMDKSKFASGVDSSALPASLDISSIYYYPYVGAPLVQ